jgi:hypothetical protein
MNFRANFSAEFTETFHLSGNTTLKVLVKDLVAADAMVLSFSMRDAEPNVVNCTVRFNTAEALVKFRKSFVFPQC